MKALGWVLMSSLLFVVLASAIAVVWARHETRVLFGTLTALQKHRDALDVDFSRLELERATWAEPSRIETMARSKLGMVDPAANAIEVIQR